MQVLRTFEHLGPLEHVIMFLSHVKAMCVGQYWCPKCSNARETYA